MGLVVETTLDFQSQAGAEEEEEEEEEDEQFINEEYDQADDLILFEELTTSSNINEIDTSSQGF